MNSKMFAKRRPFCICPKYQNTSKPQTLPDRRLRRHARSPGNINKTFHYNDVILMLWRLNSSATRLLVAQFVQTENRENAEALEFWEKYPVLSQERQCYSSLSFAFHGWYWMRMCVVFTKINQWSLQNTIHWCVDKLFLRNFICTLICPEAHIRRWDWELYFSHWI